MQSSLSLPSPDLPPRAPFLQTFQRLIYVSTQVFGDRQAAFLLPWSRVFGLTDAQVFVAKRDNARALFKAHIDALGGELRADRDFLVGLKARQAEVRLSDEEAEALVREAARAKVEACLGRAIEASKRRTRARDNSDVLREMAAALAFNRGLAALAADAEVIRGVGATSVAGSAWEAAEGRSRDLRDIYRWAGRRLFWDSGRALWEDLGDLGWLRKYPSGLGSHGKAANAAAAGGGRGPRSDER